MSMQEYAMSRWSRLNDWQQAIQRTRLNYRRAHGRPLPLFRPRRFTEKMQWRKLFDLHPIYATFCDKLAVRDFIAATIGKEFLYRYCGAATIRMIFPSSISIRPM